MTGPHWIKQWIANLALLNEQFRDENGTVDFEALGREEFLFRTALITRNFSKSERAREAYESATVAYNANVANGKKGGRPRKNQETTADGDIREAGDVSATDSNNYEARQINTAETAALDSQGRTGGGSMRERQRIVPPVRSLRLPTWDEFTEFIDALGLDYTDAREWWEMTMVDRKGLDRYGKPIGNWKGALKRFCSTKTANRRTA